VTVTDTDLPQPYRVVAATPESHDVVTLEVMPVRGDLPTFAPAQFSMIGVAGIGEVPISVSSSTADTHRYTLRRAGAVTGAVCDARPGDVVTVRGPFGRPWDLDRARGARVLFVAGGIGLAPLRAAIDAVTTGDPVATGVDVLIGVRSPRERIFTDWLDELGHRTVGVEPVIVHQTVDAVGPDEAWDGPRGPVTGLLSLATAGASRTAVYVCGPDVMMAATLRTLDELGIPASSIQLTLERNMHCANGWCGHCQLGPILVCRDGPVVDAARIGRLLEVAEL
jgi:NAD(P)H-flavin reductase